MIRSLERFLVLSHRYDRLRSCGENDPLPNAGLVSAFGTNNTYESSDLWDAWSGLASRERVLMGSLQGSVGRATQARSTSRRWVLGGGRYILCGLVALSSAYTPPSFPDATVSSAIRALSPLNVLTYIGLKQLILHMIRKGVFISRVRWGRR